MVECIQRPLGPIEASPGKPTARELVIARDKISERSLPWYREPWSCRCQQTRIIAIPHELRPSREGVINRSAQRLPSYGRIDVVKVVEQTSRLRRRTPGIGESDVNIGGFADIAIAVNVPDGAQVVERPGMKHV